MDNWCFRVPICRTLGRGGSFRALGWGWSWRRGELSLSLTFTENAILNSLFVYLLHYVSHSILKLLLVKLNTVILININQTSTEQIGDAHNLNLTVLVVVMVVARPSSSPPPPFYLCSTCTIARLHATFMKKKPISAPSYYETRNCSQFN
jgi:hypothetical protein